MDVVNVRQLKNNPSQALRSAAKGPVLVLRGNEPTALIVAFGAEGVPDRDEVKLALATALFKDGVISLGRAAQLAVVGVTQMVSHLSRLGVAIVQAEDTEVASDLETLDTWLASS